MGHLCSASQHKEVPEEVLPRGDLVLYPPLIYEDICCWISESKAKTFQVGYKLNRSHGCGEFH